MPRRVSGAPPLPHEPTLYCVYIFTAVSILTMSNFMVGPSGIWWLAPTATEEETIPDKEVWERQGKTRQIAGGNKKLTVR